MARKKASTATINTSYHLTWQQCVEMMESEKAQAFLDYAKVFPVSYCGCTSRQAYGYFKDGWTTDRPSSDTPTSTGVGYTTVLSNEGSYPDISAFLSGDPECMVAMQPESVQAPRFLRLRVGIATAHTVSATEMFAFGKRILSLVDSLESSGYRVALEVGVAVSKTLTSPIVSTVVLIKDYQEPLDEGQVCFALGHPAFLRIIFFGLADCLTTEHNPHPMSRLVDVGHGYTAHLSKGEADICIPSYLNPKMLENTIKAELAEL
jgi:hypothetical protein